MGLVGVLVVCGVAASRPSVNSRLSGLGGAFDLAFAAPASPVVHVGGNPYTTSAPVVSASNAEVERALMSAVGQAAAQPTAIPTPSAAPTSVPSAVADLDTPASPSAEADSEGVGQ